MLLEFYIQLNFFQKSTHLLNAVMKSMIKSWWPYSGALKSGGQSWRVHYTQFLSCLTTKSWNILCLQNYYIVDKHVRENSFQDFTLKLPTVLERQETKQIHSKDDQGTSPERGDERLRHMEQTILKPKNLRKELLSIHMVALSLAGIQRRPPNSTP